jgi:hypothetical protein
MSIPKVRRAVAIATLAGGTLLGSAFGIEHALAATKSPSTPSTSRPSTGAGTAPSTGHHCTHDGSSGSHSTSSTSGTGA